MPAVGGLLGNEQLLAQAEQIVLAHEAQDVLGIDLDSMDAQEVLADPPIAIEAVFGRDLLDFVAQIRLTAAHETLSGCRPPGDAR